MGAGTGPQLSEGRTVRRRRPSAAAGLPGPDLETPPGWSWWTWCWMGWRRCAWRVGPPGRRCRRGLPEYNEICQYAPGRQITLNVSSVCAATHTRTEVIVTGVGFPPEHQANLSKA